MLCLVAVSANATLELASEEYSYEEALQVTPTAVGGGLGSVIHAYDCFESCTFSFAVPTMLITPNVEWSAGDAREPSVTMYLLKGECGFASACSRTRQNERAKK